VSPAVLQYCDINLYHFDFKTLSTLNEGYQARPLSIIAPKAQRKNAENQFAEFQNVKNKITENVKLIRLVNPAPCYVPTAGVR
jgi:hypothetical protein